MATNKNIDIVCISSAPWDYPIWTNRQHIMAKVSKNHRVLYVFHPAFLRSSIKRNITLETAKKISFIRRVNKNLFAYTPFILPFRNQILGLHRVNVLISTIFLKRVLRQLGFSEYILWFYDPEGVNYLDHLSPRLSCYDCVDEYSSMPDFRAQRRQKTLEQLEGQLVERCDLVFTTSSNLYEKKKQLNRNTFLVENVGDFDHFNKVNEGQFESPRDFPKISSPIIGFVGAIDHYKVDFELIEHLATSRPEWNIVLIGSRMNTRENKRTFPNRRNIYYLGGKEYEKLPNYISKFDVCIIPYKINDYTRHVFPIKFFEFLASGKPVVTSALPSLDKYNGVIKIGRTYDDFLAEVDEMINHDSDEMRNARINIARANTWESRKDKLLSHIYESLDDRLL